jgi:predicted ArsR family transcriptional regulator
LSHFSWRYRDGVRQHATSSETHAIRAIATLSDDLRRRLYELARKARRPVSRDEAASEVGISRNLAAFHLDKLVEVGLLRSRSHSSATRGRPPKVYVPALTGIEVSIPARRYELLAEILARAVLGENEHGSAAVASTRVAHDRGMAAALQTPQRLRRGRVGPERALTLAEQVLSECGFEPYRNAAQCMRLRNCPFHQLANAMPDLVCRLNQAFTSGVLAGLHVETVEAVLAPSAGECCVELRARVVPASGE